MTAAPIVMKESLFPLESDLDVVTARRGVRDWARDLGLSVLDLTKVVTAASELARNAVIHGGGGEMCLQRVKRASHHGLRMTFRDHGRGIPKVELAMQDGFTSGGGMGIGLPGAKRLVSEFQLTSTHAGTCVTIVQWKP